MPKVHIVIPSYNHWNLTHELLWNLYRKERENINSIHVINNGSTDNDETSNGLKWWRADWKEKPDPMPIYEYHIKENVGFLLASNEGLQSVSGFDDAKPDDIIILLSNDVKILGKFVFQIKEILGGNSKSLVGGILYDRDTGWNKFGGRIYPYLEGWILATTVSNWNELGYFDERYSPNDFEDVDLSTTALSLGYELVPLNNPSLQHLGAQTIGYNPERLERTNINKKKFEEKWIK